MKSPLKIVCSFDLCLPWSAYDKLFWPGLFTKFLNLMCGKDLRKEETKLGRKK